MPSRTVAFLNLNKDCTTHHNTARPRLPAAPRCRAAERSCPDSPLDKPAGPSTQVAPTPSRRRGRASDKRARTAAIETHEAASQAGRRPDGRGADRAECGPSCRSAAPRPQLPRGHPRVLIRSLPRTHLRRLAQGCDRSCSGMAVPQAEADECHATGLLREAVEGRLDTIPTAFAGSGR
jgi:hypothetical protein